MTEGLRTMLHGGWRQVALAVALCLVAVAAWADSVTVEVSARSVADDDEVRVTFNFSGAGQGSPPDLGADWTIAGQQQGTNVQIINGRMDRSTQVTYVLVPKRTGQLTIGSATITRGGQVVAQSEPIIVAVRGAVAIKPSDVQVQPSESVAFVTEIERDVVYVGEPFIVTGVLYVRAGARIQDAGREEVVVPESVQREEILAERLREDGERTFAGQRYARIVLFQEAWRILRPETLTVPALKGIIEQQGRSIFAERARIKTLPLTLEVKAVPTTGRPAGYREGAIGQFAVSSKLTPDQARSRAVFEVTIAGQGSLTTLDAPTLPPIAGANLEPLPSDEQDVSKATPEGVTGRRVFQWLVNPTRAGAVSIPPVEYVWFDPDTGTFASARTEAQQYDAAAGVAAAVKTTVDRNEPAPRDPLRPIETTVSIAEPTPPPYYRRLWFQLLIALPFLAWLIQGIVVRVRERAARRSPENRQKRAAAMALRRIDAAGKQPPAGQNPRVAFFAELGASLRGYLEDRYQLPALGLTNDALRRELTTRGHESDAVEALVTQLDACDFARFAPSGGSDDETAAARETARALIATLEKRP